MIYLFLLPMYVQQVYIGDIREKDSSRKIPGKIIGPKKAELIFREVPT